MNHRIAKNWLRRILIGCFITAPSWGLADEIAKPGAVKDSPDVVVYRGTYPGWPWIARTPGGELVCVWREGTEHGFSATGKIMLSRSTDGGHTWSKAVTIQDEPDVDDRNVAIACLSDTDWLACYNTYTRDGVSRTLTLRTKDGGKTWSKPQLVCDLDARTRAAPVKLSTGEIVLPFYRAPGDQSLAAVSSDDAKSWSVVEIANYPGFVGDEWDLAELPDGRLLGIIRNSAPNNGGWFYKTESSDRGKTWSHAEKTNLRDSRSTSPAQIFVQEGRPVVIYSDARMVSVVAATTEDPKFVEWSVDDRLPCYWYRGDKRPIVDGSYPVSVPVSGQRRLIVDYVHDGDTHAILGYFVEIPASWKGIVKGTEATK